MTDIAAAASRPRDVGFLAVLVVLGAAGCALPFLVQSPLLLTLMTQAAINAVLATGVGFLLRQNGTVSFGHAAFFGWSAYVVGHAAKEWGLAPEFALPLGVLASSSRAPG